MIRVVLDGRKTQTRRFVHLPQAKWLLGDPAVLEATNMPSSAELLNEIARPGSGMRVSLLNGIAPHQRRFLWVRESHAEEHPLAIQDGRPSPIGRAGIPGPPPVGYRVIYRVDGEPLQVWRNNTGEHPYFTAFCPADEVAAAHPTVCSNYQRAGGKGIYWTPPMHMPRAFSRLTMEVELVRVQRLQDIREDDAKLEGAEAILVPPDGGSCPHIEGFRTLWNSINGPDAWADNPWVCAITFKVHHQNIDALLAERGLKVAA